MKQSVMVLILMVTMSVAAYATTFINRYDTPHGFSIHLPFGWDQAPENVIREFSQGSIISSESGNRNYTCGFQPYPGDNWFAQAPYILVEVNTSERINEDQIKNTDDMAEIFQKEMQTVKDQNEGFITSAYVGDTWYEDDTNTLFSVMGIDTVNGASVRILTGIILTEKGSINLYCYSTKDKFDGHVDLFRDIIGRIELDDGLEFVPKLTDSYPFLLKIKNFKLHKSPYTGLTVLIICFMVWRARKKLF